MEKQNVAEKFIDRGKFVLPDDFRGKDHHKNKNLPNHVLYILMVH